LASVLFVRHATGNPTYFPCFECLQDAYSGTGGPPSLGEALELIACMLAKKECRGLVSMCMASCDKSKKKRTGAGGKGCVIA
jgi:hypothetical protein